MPSLSRRTAAEFVGTCLLVATVVGSGIMGERLVVGNVAIALLANTIATGAALVALILTFGPVSGAHLNPAVTLADAIEHGLAWREVPAYVAAQLIGGVLGSAVAHLMFGLSLFSASQHARSGAAQVFSEFVATFGLLSVIWGCSRLRATSVPFAVGAYITAAYWFTASTSFANPAVTIARTVSNTFAGIRPIDAPAFIAAQLCGAVSATLFFRWLIPSLPKTADAILVPHNSDERAKPLPMLSPEAGSRKPEASVALAESRHTSTDSRLSAMKTYLFACVHNAGRSQMAAALFNHYADTTRCCAISAGTQPAARVHPEVVQVMQEIGIDLSHVQPQKLTNALAEKASVLVTMGCGEACPYIPGLRIIDWALTDPKGQSLDAVRSIRDDIHERVMRLLRSECSECVAAPCGR